MKFALLCLILCLGTRYGAAGVYNRDVAAWLHQHIVPAASNDTVMHCDLEGYEYEPRTGSCYKFHGAAQAWLPAMKTCHAEGGHLAIINNQTESTVLKEIRDKNEIYMTDTIDEQYISIGFIELADSEWVTIHGETLSEAGFTEWSPGEPNNEEGGEHCGSMYEDGLLNNAPCEDKFAFICESTP